MRRIALLLCFLTVFAFPTAASCAATSPAQDIEDLEESLRSYGEVLREARPLAEAKGEGFFLDLLETSRNRLMVLAPVLRSLLESMAVVPEGERESYAQRLGPTLNRIQDLAANEAFLASEIVNANEGVSAETTTLVGGYLEIVNRLTQILDRCLGTGQVR